MATTTLASALTNQKVVIPLIPELTNPNFLDILIPIPATSDVKKSVAATSPAPANPLMAALAGTAHQVLTQNGAEAYDSTLDPVLDVFYQLKKDCNETEMRGKLQKAWDQDPVNTLKVIWNARSIHDGKGEKEVFYGAWGWLYKNHPRTAIQNMHLLVEPSSKINKDGDLASHGYWKDLLNLVCLAALDQLDPVDGKRKFTFLHQFAVGEEGGDRRKRGKGRPQASRVTKHQKVSTSDKTSRPKLTSEEVAARAVQEKEAAKELRIQKHVERYETISKKLTSDRHFRALYIAVARLFADQLVKDVQTLAKLSALPAGAEAAEQRSSLAKQISLAGKWAPTPGCAHDKHSNLATAISMLVHFSQSIPDSPTGIAITSAAAEPISASDAHILRAFYQRSVLRPLRQRAHIPEPLMSSNQWKSIRYSNVASHSMKRNMPHFFLHDTEGFEAYLTSVEKGKKTMSGATLMPHELLRDAIAAHHGVSSKINTKSLKPAARAKVKEVEKSLSEAKTRTIEAQWKTMVQRIKDSGKLESSLAVCDVSGSMGYLSPNTSSDYVQPIFPSVALSILIAQVGEPPFNNGFISFSERPEFIQLDSSLTLGAMAQAMVGTAWGMNTDFEAVFLKLLLPLAKKHNVKQEDMVKRLFVFSDMQFDESRSSFGGFHLTSWKTAHDRIEKAYTKAGYKVPEIVYWNLAGGATKTTTPVTGEREGVALMSGFSQAMLKVFLGQEDEEEVEEGWDKVDKEDADETVDGSEATTKVEEDKPITPRDVMLKSLTKASFRGLVVVD
ncbi:hypothetical protein BXZ70DRAFT_742949 [Cristinia sonorae]|uniref:DUF2828 domain-containing protein n=1 Tax=Cristinia sonorae TaxID=1940300 RepID=A0A8K0UT31_9AGAR|nr:hypothetical protein BXZ70DRAFT_742949 [Cristinia sonorae]